MGTKLTQFLIESTLSIYVFAMIAICLLLRWLFPGRPNWETHYRDMINGYDKVAERNDFWADKFPNMPVDVRLWNVLRDLEEEYDATHDESLIDMIYKLRKLHNKTGYIDVREM